DMWIRTDNAFEPIVDESLFQAAQEIIRARSHRISNEEMLGRLRELLDQQGYLSGIIIDERESMPSSSAYRSRFGSLIRAYQLVGFTPDRDYHYVEVNRFLRDFYPTIVAGTIEEIRGIGGEVEQNSGNELLMVNREFTASIVISRCRETVSGSLRWHIRFD